MTPLESLRETVDAMQEVVAECQVAAIGPTWRWRLEYYEAFSGLAKALSNARKVLEESGS